MPTRNSASLLLRRHLLHSTMISFWVFLASSSCLLLGLLVLYVSTRRKQLHGKKANVVLQPRESLRSDGDTDVIIVGAGVAGAALANALGEDGRRVRVIERDLSEPNRMVGELLQPLGYLKLIELGLQDCVEGIDAQRITGHRIYKNGKSAELRYPLDKFAADVSGRGFHNGRFVQKLRQKMATLSNVTIEQGTVTSMVKQNGTIVGVNYKTKSRDHELTAYAPLTIVCDGGFSNLRRILCTPLVEMVSSFVGLVLEDYRLPCPNNSYIVMAEPSLFVLYPIGSNEVRCIVDIAGNKPPSLANGEMAHYLKSVVANQFPPEIYDAFLAAVDKGNIRTMPNRNMAASPTHTPGAILLGDALNMRNAVTGSGMTVALSDVVLLRDLIKPIRDLRNQAFLLQSFYSKRKPLAFTINSMSIALYEVIRPSTDPARKQMVQTLFGYICLGGSFSSGLSALVSGLDTSPLKLFIQMTYIGIYGIGQLLVPFPSPRRIWLCARLLVVSLGTIVPVLKGEFKR